MDTYRPELNFRFNTEALHEAIANVCSQAACKLATARDIVIPHFRNCIHLTQDVQQSDSILDDPLFQEVLEAERGFLTEA